MARQLTMVSGSSRKYFRAVTRRRLRCLGKAMPLGWAQGLGPAGGLTGMLCREGQRRGMGASGF